MHLCGSHCAVQLSSVGFCSVFHLLKLATHKLMWPLYVFAQYACIKVLPLFVCVLLLRLAIPAVPQITAIIVFFLPSNLSINLVLCPSLISLHIPSPAARDAHAIIIMQWPNSLPGWSNKSSPAPCYRQSRVESERESV